MRVAVAMSGGVDSAVTASLLKQRGHDVVGVTFRLTDPQLAVSRCCSDADVTLARDTAAAMGVAHTVQDLSPSFRTEVVEPFIASYLAGETPLPCARCNSRVKIAQLIERAAELEADAVATGHYARRGTDEAGRPMLLRGVDRRKDQSYFLFELAPEQLRAVLFPLGELHKEEVRWIAKALGLASASKPDSQEVCFVPVGGSYVDVVESGTLAGALPGRGEVVGIHGEVLGEHDGIHRYTIGQRRGIGVAGRSRLYVVALDPARNRVVIGERHELYRSSLEVRDVSWLVPTQPASLNAQVQIRSTHSPEWAELTLRSDGSARVVFRHPVLAPAPGQAAVFYDADRVLGGGWIC